MRENSGKFTLTAGLLLLLFGVLNASAQVPELRLTDVNGELDISRNLLFTNDPSAQWDLSQAIQNLAERGEPWAGPGIPVFGFDSSTYWGSINISNQFDEDQQWLVRLQFPTLDYFELFYQDKEGEWQSRLTGDLLPFASRDVDHHHLMLSFPVFAGAVQTLYFRAQTEGSMQLPLTLLSESTFQNNRQGELLLLGFYFGMLGIIAVYSAFMFTTTRDPGYLYFSLFLASMGMYLFSFQGFAYQFLWPLNPGWANISILFFIGLAGASSVEYVRKYMDTASLNKKLDIALVWQVRVSLVFAVGAFVIPYAWLSRFMTLLVFILLILLTLTSWLGIKRGDRISYYFSAAWVALMIGIFFELIQRIGVNVPPALSYNGIQFVSVFAILVLAFSMSDRVRLLIDQYESAQGNMLKANQQKIDALHKADNVKEEFIANVSHELRTPLTGIIGLSEIMLEKRRDSLDDSDRETLTMIKVSGQRLSNLVNDIIDYSAIRNGRLELHVNTVDLKQICIMVARMCRPLIGSKNIVLIENYPSGTVMVNGDEDRLQQILFNLVSNAIKFTPQGSITLKVEVLDEDARVLVQDTGIGISMDDQKKIFNRFYQVDSAESRQEGGTGLGLAISQKLVELHGTEIILRSKPGEGSTFFFDLPVAQGKTQRKLENRAKPLLLEDGEKRAAIMQSTPQIHQRRDNDMDPKAASKGELTRGKGKKILVVDDEFLNLRIVQEHLSDDYDLVTALSGHEALEIIDKGKPDLIILDLMMPIMTGFELAQRIRKRYRLDELPIVILTAKNRVEDLVKGLSVGANDYITKPFSKEELKIRVSKQFELLQLIEMKQENQRLYWELEKYQDSEKRLRERENTLAKMLDVTGDALICVDESGVIVYINSSAEELFNVDGAEYHDLSVNLFSQRVSNFSEPLSKIISFPFEEANISVTGSPRNFEFTLQFPSDETTQVSEQKVVNLCILPLSLEQELYLLIFTDSRKLLGAPNAAELNENSLPQIIDEIHKNVERTQQLQNYLHKITPEALQKHKHLFDELKNVDTIIEHMSDTLPIEAEDDVQYREALVKLMQDCHYYWQKITGESIIELAEKSRIWSVSIDNGRLRTRSMNRYLSLDKLPSNPRWRQVARTAYFVLSKVSQDEEAKRALERSVSRLQQIVEAKALN